MGQAPNRLTYRIADLACLLGCSEIAARRMVERGDIPSRRLGRRVVILPDELDAHLKSLPVRPESARRRASGA
jgi:excisionase family DNA binding protein